MKILISESEIKKRVNAIASQIAKDYKGKNLFIISILKGSFIFAADLIRALSCYNLKIEIDFIKVRSYSGTESTGKINFLSKVPDIAGKDVLIVEDIFDTGITLHSLYNNFLNNSPESIEIAVLLHKKVEREFKLPLKYIGFNIDDKFVVGYGLDYNEKFRGIADICHIEHF